MMPDASQPDSQPTSPVAVASDAEHLAQLCVTAADAAIASSRFGEPETLLAFVSHFSTLVESWAERLSEIEAAREGATIDEFEELERLRQEFEQEEAILCDMEREDAERAFVESAADSTTLDQQAEGDAAPDAGPAMLEVYVEGENTHVDGDGI